MSSMKLLQTYFSGNAVIYSYFSAPFLSRNEITVLEKRSVLTFKYAESQFASALRKLRRDIYRLATLEVGGVGGGRNLNFQFEELMRV